MHARCVTRVVLSAALFSRARYERVIDDSDLRSTIATRIVHHRRARAFLVDDATRMRIGRECQLHISIIERSTHSIHSLIFLRIVARWLSSKRDRNYNPVAETIAPQQAGPRNNLTEIRIGVELSVSDNHAFPKGRYVDTRLSSHDRTRRHAHKVGEACNGSARARTHARIVSLSIRTLARDGVRSQPGSSAPIEFLRNFVTGI